MPYVLSITLICCPLTVLPEDCGTTINSNATPAPLADCSMLCTGNGSEFCGGSGRLNLYNNTGTKGSISVTPTVQTASLPGNWQYSRCLAYVHLAPVIALRLLTLIHSEPGGTSRVFPYQIMFPQNNTIQSCLTRCSTYGYPAAGLENGDECCMWSTAVGRLRCRLWNHYL